MYSVENDDLEVPDQLAALPVEALKYYAELLALLEIAPWSGQAYNRQFPDGNMRSHPFGERNQGIAIYLVLEHQRRVVVLRVLWIEDF